MTSKFITKICSLKNRLNKLNLNQEKCGSDQLYWGVQTEINAAEMELKLVREELITKLKSIATEYCNFDFDYSILKLQELECKSKQAIRDLNVYKPSRYNATIDIIRELFK